MPVRRGLEVEPRGHTLEIICLIWANNCLGMTLEELENLLGKRLS